MIRLSHQSRLSRWLRRRAALQWASAAEALQDGGPRPPARMRAEAASLRRVLGRYLHLAEAASRPGDAATVPPDLPPGTDWHWRPPVLRGRIAPQGLAAAESGQRLSDRIALFHDCPRRSLILRQLSNGRAADLAPYGLALEVMGFAGSYLSLSIDLPPELHAGLAAHHVIRLDALLHVERPITVYGRLNIAQGPNTATVIRQMGDPVDGSDRARCVEFDLGIAELSPRPFDKLWLDLIFEAPYMNAITLSDAILSRHPRAEM